MNRIESINEYIKPEIEEIKLEKVEVFCGGSEAGDVPDLLGSVWNKNE